jgi:hypothetical protein
MRGERDLGIPPEGAPSWAFCGRDQRHRGGSSGQWMHERRFTGGGGAKLFTASFVRNDLAGLCSGDGHAQSALRAVSL